MKNQLIQTYQNQYQAHYQKLQKNKRKLAWLILARFLSFSLIIVLGVLIIPSHLFTGLLATVIMLIVFIFFILGHLQLKKKQNIIQNLCDINRNEIEALRGNLDKFEDGKEFTNPRHSFSNDLELFGNRGLYHHINRTCTYSGKNKLAYWLIHPLKDIEEIKKRQQTLDELKDMLSWRQQFLATGQMLHIEKYNDTQVIAWAREKDRGVHKPVYQVARFLLPLLSISAVTMWAINLMPVGYMILLLLFNRFVLWQAQKQSRPLYQKVTKQLDTLKSYARLTQHIENNTFQAEELNEQQKKLFEQKHPASKVISKLSKISDAIESTGNMLVDLFLNTLFLWNLHQIYRLENWHQQYASSIEKWIHVIGTFDAFTSLANFSFNNPGFTNPEFSDHPVLFTEKMGHPLIPAEKRVVNDFRIDQKGEVFIITGANMAGKSTFLRTVGVNMVLGMTGAPVCAEKMQFQITHLFTSMNITDSLTQNESYFYAEVKRLKHLVDQAAHAENMMVLLDEILTGTNTKDKETASKAFLSRLLKMNVTSLIATHDLSLTTLKEQHPKRIDNKSFEVDLIEGEMKFDYKIREGVAKNMNALELLRQMKLIQ